MLSPSKFELLFKLHIYQTYKNRCGIIVNAYFCTMEVNEALIEKLARLGRLKFNEEETQAIKKDLQNMLTLVEKMNGLNTDAVEPLLHMSAYQNIFREDKIMNSLTNNEALKNAEIKNPPFFTVPKVIKK